MLLHCTYPNFNNAFYTLKHKRDVEVQALCKINHKSLKQVWYGQWQMMSHKALRDYF